MSSDTIENLKELMNALKLIESHMYCSGVVPLDGNSSSLFYRKADGTSESLDFLNANDAQLEALAGACEAASFGRDQEDVLDEEYRKAGKMDSDKFATQFSVHTSGILDTVVSSLVKGNSQGSDIRAELYKLNVYGPGSFFKPHVDTPRSDSMFGSLVLVFPTKHEGGTLKFRQGEQQWSFESSQLVSESSEPRIAFAAFFSDVEHEVLPVTSGYRVTLTYNLYWATKREEQPAPSVEEHPFKEQAKRLLAGMLADPDFMREGGLVGFGLTHLYPIDPKTTKLSEVLLKGGDAIVKSICDELSLTTGVRALYRERCYARYDRWSANRKAHESRVLMDTFAKLGPNQINFDEFDANGYVDYLYKEEYAIKVLDTAEAIKRHAVDEELYSYRDNNNRFALVYWLKPLAKLNKFQSTFVAYGNEARAETAYGEICLVAEIAPAEERLGLAGISEGASDSPASGSRSGTQATAAGVGTEANPGKRPKAKLTAKRSMRVAAPSVADKPPVDLASEGKASPPDDCSTVAGSGDPEQATNVAAKGKRATPTPAEGVRKSTRTRKQAE